MIFQFSTGDITFFDEDKEYFESTLSALKKYLGSLAGDEDTVLMNVKMDKNKHTSGDRFECRIHTSVGGQTFDTTVETDTIRKCADIAQNKLKEQILKYKEKNTQH